MVEQPSCRPECAELGLSHEWTLFVVDSSGACDSGAGGLYGAWIAA